MQTEIQYRRTILLKSFNIIIDYHFSVLLLWQQELNLLISIFLALTSQRSSDLLRICCAVLRSLISSLISAAEKAAHKYAVRSKLIFPDMSCLYGTYLDHCPYISIMSWYIWLQFLQGEIPVSTPIVGEENPICGETHMIHLCSYFLQPLWYAIQQSV